MEQRAFLTEIRAVDGEDARVSGLGIVYDQWTELWPGYMERISKGAVKNAPTVKSFLITTLIMSCLRLIPTRACPARNRKRPRIRLAHPADNLRNDLKINLQRKNVRGRVLRLMSITTRGNKMTRVSSIATSQT